MKNCTKIAEAYYTFLRGIDWGNDFYTQGIRDGKKTFLTNAFLGTYGEKKYSCGDYYSPAAWKIVQSSNKPSGLIFEHMVPKKKYIHAPCEKLAESGDLTVPFIENLLQKFWKIAIVTKEEDMHLGRNSMPANWDEEDIFGRYTAAGVTLVDASGKPLEI